MGQTEIRSGRWPWWRKARHYIRERGIRTTVVARRLGVNRRTLNRWLRGENAPADFRMLSRLAEILGVSERHLRRDDEPYRVLDAPEGVRVTTEAELEAIADRLPEDMADLLLACADPDVFDWLRRSLAHYHTMHGRMPRGARK